MTPNPIKTNAHEYFSALMLVALIVEAVRIYL
jgi:hypothetical protein